MDDDVLDALLVQARPEVSRGAAEAARQLADATAARELGVRPGGRHPAARMLVATGVGVLALTGATTFSAYQLGIPPFQTTEPGIVRVERAVPVDYTLTSGRSISCDAFVEARDPSDTQLRQLRAMVTSTDWDGYGQRVYRSLSPAEQAVTTAPGPVGDAVLVDLAARARAAAPGTDVTGGAISCIDGTRGDAG